MIYYQELVAYSDWGFLFLRAALASIFLYQGMGKLLKAKMVAGILGSPTAGPFVLGLVETLSALSVLLGYYPQVGAAFMAIVMLGAIFAKKFMWKLRFMEMKNTGWEFDWLILASSVLLIVNDYGFVLVG